MVRHYRKTAPNSERIEEELTQHPQVVEVVEVSSGEENTEEEDAEDDADEEKEEEVTIVKEKSTEGPVVGSSSESSGKILR